MSPSDSDFAPQEWPLRTIYAYVAEGCNCRCRHCWIAPPHAQPGETETGQLDPTLFREVIAQARPLGLTGVKITGGEPLLHSEITTLLDIVLVEKMHLALETNGTLCTPALARRLADHPGAVISVSLDGMNAELHDWMRGLPGAFEAAMAGIRHLTEVGVKPEIIMTLTRRNAPRLREMVDFCAGLKCSLLKINLLMPSARAQMMQERGEALSIDEVLELGAWMEEEVIPTAGFDVLFHHPPAFRRLPQLLGAATRGRGQCGMKHILGMLCDGSFALCGIGYLAPGLVFGHASTDPVAAVWRNHPVLTSLREGLPRRLTGVCAQCLFNHTCLGFCIAQNYLRARSLWAPCWYCQEAFDRAAFPESRLRPDLAPLCA